MKEVVYGIVRRLMILRTWQFVYKHRKKAAEKKPTFNIDVLL